MRFADLWVLLFIPLIIFLFFLFRNKNSINFPSVKILKNSDSGKTIKHKIGKILVLTGLIFAIIALARPQTHLKTYLPDQMGIDIVMAIDVSGSMNSFDFNPNRLEGAKRLMAEFIEGRKGDRISLVVFSGSTHTRVPLTLDHEILLQSLSGVSFNSATTGGTAVGMAIATGITRLRDSIAESKVVILLTDGDSNSGYIDPLTAAKIAKERDIKVYTIGVGGNEINVPIGAVNGTPQYHTYMSNYNGIVLEEIAEITEAEYFHALTMESLEEVFDTIDQLEKTEFDGNTIDEYTEWAFPLIITALAFLILGIILDKYLFVQIP